MAGSGTEVARAYVTIIPKSDGTSDKVVKSIVDPLEKGGNDAGEKAGGGFEEAFGAGVKKAGAAFAALGLGAAVTNFAKQTVEAGMQFDASMSQVAATMGKSMDELNSQVVSVGDFEGTLRDFAQEMGASTAFSASQAADALNYMALAGYDAETSVSMLPNVLNLAAAGGIDLAYASDMVTDASSALGLSIDETTQLVDKMAQTSSKSNTSVSQMGEAILTVGGTAKNLAGGVTEMSTALGILADNGVKGSEGGTALRNIILSLSSPTDKAAIAMNDLGVAVFDAEGNMRPLNEIFGDMGDSLDSLTQEERQQALSAIFHKVDLKSVNALLANTSGNFDGIRMAVDSATGGMEGFANAMSASGETVSDEFVIALQDGLASATMTTEELQQQLEMEFDIDADSALAAINAASEAVEGNESRWQQLSRSIDQAWYSAASLGESMAGAGLDLDAMRASMEGLGVTAEEFDAALGQSGGDADKFADMLLAAADNGTGFEQVATALGGDLEALGIAFSEAKGAAQAMADTQLDNLQGDTTIFQSALEGLQIAISDAVTPALRTFVQIGTEGLGLLTEAMGGVQAFIDQFAAGFASAIDSEGFAAAFGQIGGAVSEAFGGQQQADATGFGAAVGGMLNNLLPMVQAIAPVLGGIASVVSTIADTLQTVLGAAIEAVMSYMNLAAETMAAKLTPALQVAGEVMGAVTPVVQAIGEAFAEVGSAVFEVVSSVFGTLGEVFGAIGELFGEVCAELFGATDSTFPSIGETVRGAMDVVKSVVGPAWQTVKLVMTSVMEAVKGVVQAVWPNIKGVVLGVVGAVKGAIEGISGVVGGVVSTFGRIRDAMKGPLEAAGGVVKAVIGGIKGAIGGVSAVVSGITRTFASIRDAIKGPIEAAGNAVSGAMEAISKAFDIDLSFPEIKLPEIKVDGGEAPWGIAGQGRLPSFEVIWNAKGGIVDGATLIGAGERGPEAIIPLSGERVRPFASMVAGEMGANGDVYNFNLQYDADSNATDMVHDMARKVRLVKLARGER